MEDFLSVVVIVAVVLIVPGAAVSLIFGINFFMAYAICAVIVAAMVLLVELLAK